MSGMLWVSSKANRFSEMGLDGTKQHTPLCPESRAKPAGQRTTAPSRRWRACGTTRALLRRLGKELLPEVRHHKALKPGIAVPTRRPCTALRRQGLTGLQGGRACAARFPSSLIPPQPGWRLCNPPLQQPAVPFSPPDRKAIVETEARRSKDAKKTPVTRLFITAKTA